MNRAQGDGSVPDPRVCLGGLYYYKVPAVAIFNLNLCLFLCSGDDICIFKVGKCPLLYRLVILEIIEYVHAVGVLLRCAEGD